MCVNCKALSTCFSNPFTNTIFTKRAISGTLNKSEDQKPMTAYVHLSRFYNEFRKISIYQKLKTLRNAVS